MPPTIPVSVGSPRSESPAVVPTGNAKTDAAPLVRPQRGEITLDAAPAGLMSPARRLAVWFSFGLGEVKDPAARITGQHFSEVVLPRLRAGDVILCGGEDGHQTHAIVYAGEGKIVHSMATEKTKRSVLRRIGDTLAAPFIALAELTGLKKKRRGVIEEQGAEFFDRFFRGSYVVLRSPLMTPERAFAGAGHVRAFLGARYDHNLLPGNGDYYCTEIVEEFMRAALGAEAPRVGARPVDYGFLMQRRAVIDPENFLQTPDLQPVIASANARKYYPLRLGDGSIA